MSEFVIHCPECNKGLKVRDASKLGKKAGCPKCGHVFVLSLPKHSSDDSEEEIEFELADKSQAPLVNCRPLDSGLKEACRPGQSAGLGR